MNYSYYPCMTPADDKILVCSYNLVNELSQSSAIKVRKVQEIPCRLEILCESFMTVYLISVHYFQNFCGHNKLQNAFP